MCACLVNLSKIVQQNCQRKGSKHGFGGVTVQKCVYIYIHIYGDLPPTMNYVCCCAFFFKKKCFAFCKTLSFCNALKYVRNGVFSKSSLRSSICQKAESKNHNSEDECWFCQKCCFVGCLKCFVFVPRVLFK